MGICISVISDIKILSDNSLSELIRPQVRQGLSVLFRGVNCDTMGVHPGCVGWFVR